jgi:hypothetical protein
MILGSKQMSNGVLPSSSLNIGTNNLRPLLYLPSCAILKIDDKCYSLVVSDLFTVRKCNIDLTQGKTLKHI